MNGREWKVNLILMISSGILISTFGISCSSALSNLEIFASASAKSAFDRVCQQFQEKSGITTETNYGGGGEVLSQIILSQSGDIYIAPEQGFMEMAMEKQAIFPETVKTVAYMIPVIAVKKGNPRNIQTLADLARPGIKVAITRPETTLLGRYAHEIFAKAGLSDEIEENIITVAARPDNLLTMLIMNQIDAGIIWHFYQLEASDYIENIFLFQEQLTGIGEMQAAISVYSQDKRSAQKLIDYITSVEGRAVLKQAGYFVEEDEVKKYWP